MARWMSERGARKFVLTSRQGLQTGYQQWMVERMQRKGADVNISRLDVTHLEQAQELLTMAGNIAPIGGIFHLAAVCT